MLSDHNMIKVKINGKRNHENYAKTQKLNNVLLDNQWVTEEVKEKIDSS